MSPASLCRLGLSRRYWLSVFVMLGGPWARWGVNVCPRTPRLTLVLDAGWLPVGHMMWWGVRDGLRPLSLTRPFPGERSAAGGRELAAVHRLISGLPRDRWRQLVTGSRARSRPSSVNSAQPAKCG